MGNILSDEDEEIINDDGDVVDNGGDDDETIDDLDHVDADDGGDGCGDGVFDMNACSDPFGVCFYFFEISNKKNYLYKLHSFLEVLTD